MQDVNRFIRERYASVAASGLSSERESVRRVSLTFGYGIDELRQIPSQANLGLSCGHPLRYARLQPGEAFLDLGCGAGMDVFLGAAQVGPTGRAVGVDITEQMISLARRNARNVPEGSAVPCFLVASMDQVPLLSGSVDCVISNSAINMTQDKQSVFVEAFRLLKPGGRVSFSDLALRPTPRTRLVGDMAAAIGFMPSTLSQERYRELLQRAGFADIEMIETALDLNVYSNVWAESAVEGRESLPPLAAQDMRELSRKHDLNDYAVSVQVCAAKPF